MRTRHKAVALAAAVSILAFKPAMAGSARTGAGRHVRRSTSELDRSDREEPLAQTGDKRWLFGSRRRSRRGTAGLGLHIKHSQKQNMNRCRKF